MKDICRMSGVKQARLIKDRKISPVEVVDALLEQIEKVDPVLHAFCTLDAEQAKKTAKKAEEEIMRGESGKAILGVPFAVKDMICTKGVRTTFGSKAYENFYPEEDDVAVARLKEAGAILIGKTNTPEFAYEGVSRNKLFPETVNPWNTDKTSGGSSGGSAVAAAAGMTALTLGNDGGGSVRIPTSFCGVYGIKPTFGRVPLYPGCRDPRYPGCSSWETLEAIGPITRKVEDAALMLSVMAGPHPMDRHSFPDDGTDWLGSIMNPDLRGKKIAYWSHLPYCSVEQQVSEIVRNAVDVFRQLGADVEETEPPITANPEDAFWALVARDSDISGMRRMAAEYGDDISSIVAGFANREWTTKELTDAHFIRQKINIQIRRFMEKYDLILTPTLTTAAFDIGLDGPQQINGKDPDAGWTSFTFLFNLTGQPAATLPAGFTKEGLPVGVQVAGRQYDEALVLMASAAFEKAHPWSETWPKTVL